MADQQIFANIIIPLALPKLYTYSIPEEFREEVEIGKRVIIQFGKKKFYSGIVNEIHQSKPDEYETKEIISVLDEKPVVNKFQLKLWDWIANYYCCTIGEVLKATLPAGLKLESETKISLNPDLEETSPLNHDEQIIVSFLENNPVSNIQKINSIIGQNKALSTIKSLLSKEIICVEEKLSEGYLPKLETFIGLNKIYKNEGKLNELFDTLKRAPRQQKLLVAYLSKIDINKLDINRLISKKELLTISGSNDSALNSLIKKDIFYLIKRKKDRISIKKGNLNKPKILNQLQSETLQKIKNNFIEKNVVLLHGVTSSGKTEIYIHLINEYLAKNKQILYLLPEIALTSQIINRLRSVFGNQVGVYHSKFSDNERVEIYNQVNNQKSCVILGVRSSVFLPFSNLGLVIIDEEHENSYKQFDPAPRYHARDTAIMLGKIHNSKILLGTATPAIETYYNTKIGKFGIVEISERYLNIELPEIIIANTLEARKKKLMKADLTPQLFEHIQHSLDKKEQIILFQNRRGFSPYLECTLCGWIPYCNNCDVSLTYHKQINRMVCHYCGFSYKTPHSCKACESSQIEMRGFGTEKIENDIALLFPDAQISRMDLDSTRRKKAYDQIISDFENRKIDILVGTQMVTKGLDFDNVSLVGILNADNMLNFPDFRAFERSYQLMAQVSGRAGRKNKRGKVIIQTSNPNHKIIKFVIDNDYEGMLLSQLSERKKFRYPPFFRLIIITVKHKKPDILEEALTIMTRELKNYFKDRILGPQAPVVSRIQNWYIKNYILKLEKDSYTNKAKEYLLKLMNFIKSQPNFSALQTVIDVDPQ